MDFVGRQSGACFAIQLMNIEYAVQIIWSPEDNAYVAITAELPGCIADGKTPEEALANVRVIINEWIEVAREDNREIPKPLTIEDMGLQAVPS